MKKSKPKRTDSELKLAHKAKPMLILFKVLEVLAVLAIFSMPYCLATLAKMFRWIAPSATFLEMWTMGMVYFVITAIIVAGVILVGKFIYNLNKKWAIQFVKKIRQ
jgi:hypothetical protein